MPPVPAYHASYKAHAKTLERLEGEPAALDEQLDDANGLLAFREQMLIQYE